MPLTAIPQSVFIASESVVGHPRKKPIVANRCMPMFCSASIACVRLELCSGPSLTTFCHLSVMDLQSAKEFSLARPVVHSCVSFVGRFFATRALDSQNWLM